jgi:hypothetical protein
MLKGEYPLPFQRINGADVSGNMGNQRGPVFPLTGAALFGPVYDKGHAPDGRIRNYRLMPFTLGP